jgi:hypothetical protein
MDALLDAALAGETRTIVVVGTAKNVGKTVAFNALRALAARRGLVGAITSIGRDGEAADALDGAEKPRVRVEAGTLVALPRELVPRTPALEIVDIGEASALGRIVFARARYGATCEIGGPPTARAVRATIDRLAELTTGPVFVDGAIDRIAPLAGGRQAARMSRRSLRSRVRRSPGSRSRGAIRSTNGGVSSPSLGRWTPASLRTCSLRCPARRSW